MSPMDPGWKDWLQAAAWVATASGVIVAAIKLRSELRESRLQRDRELRWRQAEAGKNLNDEMQSDKDAWDAMNMLDSTRREYQLGNGQSLTVCYTDIAPALHPGANADDEKTVFICESFDRLFYFFAMLDHYISNTLILEDDVAYPVEYYVPLLAELCPQISAYLDRYNLWRTRRFLERYPAWITACAKIKRGAG